MQTFKFSLLALGVLLAATFTGCDSPITVGLLPAPDSSTIHVSGSGSVTGEPDLAMLRLGVSVERKSVAEAREEAASAMTTVLESLTANGIAETDVQTQAFSIRPEYDYDYDRDPVQILRGYRVSNDVTAKVRDLETLSQVIDDAAAAGGNVVLINSIQFMIEDNTALATQARILAVKDAEAKAQTLAKESGVTIGKPLAISEQTNTAAPPIAFDKALAAVAEDASVTATPVQAGELTVTVNITVVYEIE